VVSYSLRSDNPYLNKDHLKGSMGARIEYREPNIGRIAAGWKLRGVRMGI
jgi:hypothetical protein